MNLIEIFEKQNLWTQTNVGSISKEHQTLLVGSSCLIPEQQDFVNLITDETRPDCIPVKTRVQSYTIFLFGVEHEGGKTRHPFLLNQLSTKCNTLVEEGIMDWFKELIPLELSSFCFPMMDHTLFPVVPSFLSSLIRVCVYVFLQWRVKYDVKQMGNHTVSRLLGSALLVPLVEIIPLSQIGNSDGCGQA
jgi:hypothetical protein